MFFQIFIFLLSVFVLLFSGKILIKSLSRISEVFKLKEFTVSFFIMSLATASPELFIGISSALNKSSELSLGNIIGQNIIHFTLAIAICVFVGGPFFIKSETIKRTAWFSALMAVLPLVLVSDGYLGRIDGIVLLLGFAVFSFWIFGKREMFERDFLLAEGEKISKVAKLLRLFRESFYFIIGIGLLVISAQGIVSSSVSFAGILGVPLVFIGAVIVGLGTALPEVYFSAVSAFSKKSSLMAGNLLGSTVISTSLVLGLVAIIEPISVNISFYAVNRAFLFLAVVLFIIFMISGRKIDRKEAFVLFTIYILFVLFEIMALS